MAYRVRCARRRRWDRGYQDEAEIQGRARHCNSERWDELTKVDVQCTATSCVLERSGEYLRTFIGRLGCAAFLLTLYAGRSAPRCRPPMVHGAVWQRQYLHEL